MHKSWRNLSRTMFGPLDTQWLIRAALACLALTALPLCALADDAAKGDAAHGEIIAKRWCAACHLVASGQAEANSDAPPFVSIARKKQASELKDFLTDPHPKMPNMSLSRSEIADIVAYIKTLDR
jgi:mono/diheme cytochrome c family protein